MQVIDEILFTPNGGMNKDVDPRSIPKGDVIEVLNGRWCKSFANNIGSLEKIIGNKLINFVFPEGENTIIKTVEDTKRNYIYALSYNEYGKHCILRINPIIEEIDPILYDEDILNFNLNYPVHLDFTEIGVEGMLFWTDKYNPPRHLDIERARKYTYETKNSGIGYWIIEDDFVIS